jgi:hypothetical protein
MKFSFGVIAAVVGVVMATSAQAQVKAEKSALRKAEENVYGRLETRHTTNRKMEGSEVTNDIPKLDARPTLGTVIGKLDLSATTIFTKRADTTKIEKTVTYSELSYDLLSGKYGSIKPYAYTEMNPNSGNVNQHEIGADLDTSYAIPTTIGSVTLSAFQYTYGVFHSGKGQPSVAVRNESGRGLALAGDNQDEIKQRDPEVDSYTGVGVKLAPVAVPGLTVGLSNEVRKFWVPKYVAKDVAGDQRVELDGYRDSSGSITKFAVGYKLNDKVTLTNSLRHNVAGFYAQGIDDSNANGDKMAGLTSRWENRLILSATLF